MANNVDRTVLYATIGLGLIILLFWGLRGTWGINLPIPETQIGNIPVSGPPTTTTITAPPVTVTTTVTPNPLETTGLPVMGFEGWWVGNALVVSKSDGRYWVDWNTTSTLKLAVTSGEYVLSGKLTVEIKKDYFGKPDPSVLKRDFSINLQPWQDQVVDVTFTPNEATSASGTCREYFFKLYWNDQVFYDPCIPLSRYGLGVYPKVDPAKLPSGYPGSTSPVYPPKIQVKSFTYTITKPTYDSPYEIDQACNVRSIDFKCSATVWIYTGQVCPVQGPYSFKVTVKTTGTTGYGSEFYYAGGTAMEGTFTLSSGIFHVTVRDTCGGISLSSVPVSFTISVSNSKGSASDSATLTVPV